MLKFEYLKDLENVDTFNIGRVDSGKENDKGKGGWYVTAIIAYKTTFVVNEKPITVSLTLGEGVACNTIFSWPLLQTIKASIMTNNNKSLVSGIMEEQFSMEIMVTKISKEAPKTS